MRYIYYSLAVFAFIYELGGFFNPKDALDEKNKLLENLKKEEKEDLTSSQIVWIISTFFYLFWMVIGLFTFQWFAFLVLLVMGLVPKKWVWYIFIDSVISIAIILFIVLNAFHFKISLF
jgi:phosphoglycerol transferase MdoB-like AlkP superfamily enzyme